MISRRTVLILGAGASAPYGLPLGSTLRRSILEMSDLDLRRLPTSESTPRPTSIEADFKTAFRGSRAESIDAFLARREEFIDIGKHAIAACLLPRESASRLLHSDVEEDDWYTYLLRRMDASWDDLPKNQISFVTFNYDRSLEMCLLHTFQHRYRKSEEEALRMLDNFPIVHVYGSLGSLDNRQPNFVPYGGGGLSTFSNHLATAASGLRIIAEGRDDSPELQRARSLISEADAHCFLGFGFDETNVARLGGTSMSMGLRKSDRGLYHLAFASTALGLTRTEADAIADLIAHPEARREIRQGMFDERCLSTLKKSLILQ
jgi:hypothetical protein